MMATHSSGSFWNSSKTSDSSALAGGWRAFMTSGRLIVTMKRWPSRSLVLKLPMAPDRTDAGGSAPHGAGRRGEAVERDVQPDADAFRRRRSGGVLLDELVEPL